MTNRIEQSIKLKALISVVWRALTDHRKFGEWFRVKIDGPFIASKTSHGQNTYPGFEHVKWEAVVQKMEPEHFFSYTWHPYAIDPKIDYSKESPTLVEFKLEKTQDGALLTVTETGFDNIPKHRQQEAFSKHEGGWATQLKNIEDYLAKNSH